MTEVTKTKLQVAGYRFHVASNLKPVTLNLYISIMSFPKN
jgi:hypothetical protein